jgi:uncharacterized membrane protein
MYFVQLRIAGLVPFIVPFMWGSASLRALPHRRDGRGHRLLPSGASRPSARIDDIVPTALVISGATRIPFLLVLFGVLGGLAAFGLVGLFIGPVILAVIMAVWREWLAEAPLSRERPNTGQMIQCIHRASAKESAVSSIFRRTTFIVADAQRSRGILRRVRLARALLITR